MHTVVRVYSGTGAGEVMDFIIANKPSIEKMLRGSPGFGSYAIVRTPTGGFTVTTTDSEAASDAIVQLARDWLVQNAPHIKADPPQVMGGTPAWHLT